MPTGTIQLSDLCILLQRRVGFDHETQALGRNMDDRLSHDEVHDLLWHIFGSVPEVEFVSIMAALRSRGPQTLNWF